MTAQFHRRALHVRAGQRGQLLADRRRAGERDLADHRMRNQVARDLSRVAEHQADRARRHAGIDESLQQRSRRGRAFLPVP